MARSKTLYIRDIDLPTWKHATDVAKERRQSVSVLVAAALRAYLPAPPATDR